jgi:hypothetical protein
LDKRSKDGLVEFEVRKIFHHDFDAQRARPRLHDLDGLRMAVVRDEECFSATYRGMAERHRFRRCRAFIEQRRVRDVERGQIGDHRLEVQERFEPALRNLRLVRRVSRIPARILQNVPLDNRRRDRVGIAGANKGTRDDVFPCELPQLSQRVPL